MAEAEPSVPPDVVTFNTLMNKAEVFEDARSVIDLMAEAEPSVPPDVVTFSTLMNKAEVFEDIEHAVALWKRWGQFPNQVFGALTQSLSTRMDASDMFGACFNVARSQGIKFPTTAFQQAISGYVARSQTEHAFRVCVAFPHLPGAAKTMKAFPVEAEVFFQRHFEEEPNHASYALAKLFEALGRVEPMLKWANIALKQEKQPKSRLNDILRMLNIES